MSLANIASKPSRGMMMSTSPEMPRHLHKSPPFVGRLEKETRFCPRRPYGESPLESFVPRDKTTFPVNIPATAAAVLAAERQLDQSADGTARSARGRRRRAVVHVDHAPFSWAPTEMPPPMCATTVHSAWLVRRLFGHGLLVEPAEDGAALDLRSPGSVQRTHFVHDDRVDDTPSASTSSARRAASRAACARVRARGILSLTYVPLDRLEKSSPLPRQVRDRCRAARLRILHGIPPAP